MNFTIEEIKGNADVALDIANKARCGDWKSLAKLPTIVKHLAITNHRLAKALYLAWNEELFFQSEVDTKIELILQGQDE